MTEKAEEKVEEKNEAILLSEDLKEEDVKGQEIEKEKTDKAKKVEKAEKSEKTKTRAKTLVPLEDYIKASIHLGTKVITPHMREYVYRRRADGLAVLNTELIDAKIKEGSEFLNSYEPDKVILVCKREAGWTAAKKFSEITGIRVFTKKYPAGITTNIKLREFFEPDMTIICDPWLDKNALKDAQIVNKKVMGLCDTNNFTQGINVLIPCNNKSSKSLGLVLYLLAKEYIAARKIDKKMPPMQDFTGIEEDEEGKKKEESEKKRLEEDKKMIEQKLKTGEKKEEGKGLEGLEEAKKKLEELKKEKEKKEQEAEKNVKKVRKRKNEEKDDSGNNAVEKAKEKKVRKKKVDEKAGEKSD